MDLFAADLYYIVERLLFALQRRLSFLRAVTSYRRKAEERKISRKSRKGAHMLVRRDVELTTATRLRRLDDVKSGFISVVAHQPEPRRE